jgi:hypothetical protein
MLLFVNGETQSALRAAPCGTIHHNPHRHGKDVVSHDVSARATEIGQAERDLSLQIGGICRPKAWHERWRLADNYTTIMATTTTTTTTEVAGVIIVRGGFNSYVDAGTKSGKSLGSRWEVAGNYFVQLLQHS